MGDWKLKLKNIKKNLDWKLKLKNNEKNMIEN
jgi:hypothetical protein